MHSSHRTYLQTFISNFCVMCLKNHSWLESNKRNQLSPCVSKPFGFTKKGRWRFCPILSRTISIWMCEFSVWALPAFDWWRRLSAKNYKYPAGKTPTVAGTGLHLPASYVHVIVLEMCSTKYRNYVFCLFSLPVNNANNRLLNSSLVPYMISVLRHIVIRDKRVERGKITKIANVLCGPPQMYNNYTWGDRGRTSFALFFRGNCVLLLLFIDVAPENRAYYLRHFP